jgi:hypothetical protein
LHQIKVIIFSINQQIKRITQMSTSRDGRMGVTLTTAAAELVGADQDCAAPRSETFPLLWLMGKEWSLIKFGREREEDLQDSGCVVHVCARKPKVLLVCINAGGRSVDRTELRRPRRRTDRVSRANVDGCGVGEGVDQDKSERRRG